MTNNSHAKLLDKSIMTGGSWRPFTIVRGTLVLFCCIVSKLTPIGALMTGYAMFPSFSPRRELLCPENLVGITEVCSSQSFFLLVVDTCQGVPSIRPSRHMNYSTDAVAIEDGHDSVVNQGLVAVEPMHGEVSMKMPWVQMYAILTTFIFLPLLRRLTFGFPAPLFVEGIRGCRDNRTRSSLQTCLWLLQPFDTPHVWRTLTKSCWWSTLSL